MINKINVYGIDESVVASGYPMMTDTNLDQDTTKSFSRMKRLGNAKAGSGHNNCLKGIIVQFDWRTPVLMQPQIQRYNFIDIISSQSAMHRITNRDAFTDDDFANKISPIILLEMNLLLIKYKESGGDKGCWRDLIDNLPQSYLKTARYTTNYLQLQTMYNQRKDHKLDEWKELCCFCEALPFFNEFCLGGGSN